MEARFSVTLASGCVLNFICDTEERGQSSEVIGLSNYTFDFDTDIQEKLLPLEIYSYNTYGEESVNSLESLLDDYLEDFSVDSADTFISIVAILGDNDAWKAIGSPETVTIEVTSESSAFWVFHDLAHAENDWSVDLYYGTEVSVFPPSELDAQAEVNAHALGVEKALAAGMPKAHIAAALVMPQVQVEHLARFGYDLDLVPILESLFS